MPLLCHICGAELTNGPDTLGAIGEEVCQSCYLMLAEQAMSGPISSWYGAAPAGYTDKPQENGWYEIEPGLWFWPDAEVGGGQGIWEQYRNKGVEMTIGSSFEALARSTAALHERFSVQQEVDAALACLFEEFGEFIDEASSSRALRRDLTDEAADVVVTLLGVLRAWSVTVDELAAAFERVAAKNDAKTHATHEVNAAGKIARR